ncbi:unnamed protein product [Paramecium pentaurelia]|uniref:Uncharacterized protein n=1 Tax=Paramecium pentaurelia TaxID=43138 RepID=A0A8S1TIU9_9CILI|nr:unnamed protein product [Paramecium pentaurelia]
MEQKCTVQNQNSYLRSKQGEFVVFNSLCLRKICDIATTKEIIILMQNVQNISNNVLLSRQENADPELCAQATFLNWMCIQQKLWIILLESNSQELC